MKNADRPTRALNNPQEAIGKTIKAIRVQKEVCMVTFTDGSLLWICVEDAGERCYLKVGEKQT